MQRLGLTGNKLYSVFVVRRIFRIYPLSVLAVFLVVAFHIPSTPWFGGTVTGGYVWPGWQGLISNLLLTQNITHRPPVICVLWSLPFEVQMYAILPLLYLLIRRFPSLHVISLIWLGTAAIAILEYFSRNAADSDSLLLRYFPCFLAGVVAWRLMESHKGRIAGRLWALVLIALVALYRLEDVLRVYGPNWQSTFHGILRNDHQIWLPPSLDLVRDWLFCGAASLTLPLFSDISSHWMNALTKRVAQYSYGVYVCHVPLMWLCFNRLHLGNSALSVIMTVSLTALVSIAVYHIIEHPAIQFGKHLSARLVNVIAFT
jgi:peptidoglycan/LPS O-acetylase OafA/YrhL